jgi:hypothetical protein
MSVFFAKKNNNNNNKTKQTKIDSPRSLCAKERKQNNIKIKSKHRTTDCPPPPPPPPPPRERRGGLPDGSAMIFLTVGASDACKNAYLTCFDDDETAVSRSKTSFLCRMEVRINDTQQKQKEFMNCYIRRNKQKFAHEFRRYRIGTEQLSSENHR